MPRLCIRSRLPQSTHTTQIRGKVGDKHYKARVLLINEAKESYLFSTQQYLNPNNKWLPRSQPGKVCHWRKWKINDDLVIYTSRMQSQGTEVMNVLVSLGDCQRKHKLDQEMIIQPYRRTRWLITELFHPTSGWTDINFSSHGYATTKKQINQEYQDLFTQHSWNTRTALPVIKMSSIAPGL